MFLQSADGFAIHSTNSSLSGWTHYVAIRLNWLDDLGNAKPNTTVIINTMATFGGPGKLCICTPHWTNETQCRFLGQMSYPNYSGVCKFAQFPDVRILAEIMEYLGLDFRILGNVKGLLASWAVNSAFVPRNELFIDDLPVVVAYLPDI